MLRNFNTNIKKCIVINVNFQVILIILVRPINFWFPFSALKRRVALQQLGPEADPLDKYQTRVVLIHFCFIFKNRPRVVPSHSAAVRSSTSVTFSRSNSAQPRFRILRKSLSNLARSSVTVSLDNPFFPLSLILFQHLESLLVLPFTAV